MNLTPSRNLAVDVIQFLDAVWEVDCLSSLAGTCGLHIAGIPVADSKVA